jgi:deoxyribonuclease-4
VRIGCHLSISKGFAAMLRLGEELGAEIVQYFPKNPRSYRLKVFDPSQLQEEYEQTKELDIVTVAHSPYVTNLSTGDPELREITVASIVNDLEIADAYRSPGLVIHCGKHVGQGEQRGLELMVDALDEIMQRYEGSTRILLENTAGQGSELGRTIDDLLEIHDRLASSDRVGFCFDTCHAFAAGVLDFERWDEVKGELTREEFRSKVELVHLNDSMMSFGDKKDRHQLLGQGKIGSDDLGRFLASDIFPEVGVVIETPVEKERDYAEEIAIARQWVPD